MNTKTILKNCIYVLVGSVIAVGVSYLAHAATFTAPSGTPPASNTAFPINVGTANQVKGGGLSVLGFIANQNAELDGNSYFSGTWHADPAGATPTTINFGGTDPKNIIRTVALALTGGFGNTGSIASTPLANNTMAPVCSDSSGSVILCTALDMCSNISGIQTTVPQGYASNSDGTCSPIPKRFLSITTSGNKSAEYFSNGLVVNSTVIYHTPGQKNGMAFVAALGLDNDSPFGWVVDTINRINGTGFDTSHTTLLNVTENGTYNIHISSQGQIGIKGKFSDDQNWFGADFYMKVHTGGADQWIHLVSTPPVSGPEALAHEPYPITSKTTSDFELWVDGNQNTTQNFPGMTWGGSGDAYSYTSYNFDFNKTMALSQGDTIDVYALIYGLSTTGDGSAVGAIGNALGGTFHNSPNNFTYSISTPVNGTTFDITENPS